MPKTIQVRDGDVLSGYKEYLQKSLIAMGMWKGAYPKQWEAAGGATITYNGREYFGGRFNIDAVNTEAEKLLKFTGVDDVGIQQIRDAYHHDGTEHVYMNFKPRQTFTLDGLKWFLSQTVSDTLNNENITSFTMKYYSEAENTQRTEPYTPYSGKSSPTSGVCLTNTLDDPQPCLTMDPLTSNLDVDNALRLIYILTDWFETHESVSTTVNEIVVPPNGSDTLPDTYVYETVITISLTNRSYLNSGVIVEDLYNLIYLGDTSDIYYTIADSSDFSGVQTYSPKHYAAAFWSLEYEYQGGEASYLNDFNDGGENLVIYLYDQFWIDRELWLRATPAHAMTTLGRLINIGVQNKSCDFFCSFIRFVAGFFNAIVGVFGEVVYSVFYVWGLWVLDVMASEGWISQYDLARFKEISKKVMGTVALLVITSGVVSVPSVTGASATGTSATLNSSMQALALTGNGTGAAVGMTVLEGISYVLSAVDLVIDVYNDINTDEPQEITTTKNEKEAKDPIAFVYESDEMDAPTAEETIIDHYYELSDVYMMFDESHTG